MRDNKYRHVLRWAVGLLFAWPWVVPKRLRFVWVLTWALLVVFVWSAATGLLAQGLDLVERLTSGSALLSIASLLIVGIVNGAVLYYIGDAARYLDPSPDNIAQRQVIRREGVELLRRLHERGKYDRIIVAGHSLGSVIAYDLINHLWDDYRTQTSKPDDPPRQEALVRLEQIAARITRAEAEVANVGRGPEREAARSETEALLAEYQTTQRELWREMRKLGNPWLITDLVTMGSPLAHASYLLASSRGEFEARKRERDYPTCPPAAFRGGFSYTLRPYENSRGELRTLRVLHESAPFACVRWTNIYFRCDIVGGRLADVFGGGILDRQVRLVGGPWTMLINRTMFTHTMYWRKKPKPKRRVEDSRERDAVTRLRSSLDIENRALLEGLA